MKPCDCIRIAQHELPKITNRYRHWTFILDRRNNLVEWATNSEGHAGNIIACLGYKENRHSLHSEVAALRKASGLIDMRRDGAFNVVNVRLTKSGEIRMSRPCKLCISMLDAWGVGKVWYTTSEGVFACL